MDYCVYKHTTPSGKVYIGITSTEPERRWCNGHGYANNPYFSKAIKKYGWDNIKHEIVFSGLCEEEACQKERELISKYNSTDKSFGYNLMSGGQNGNKHSAESIEKMKRAKAGMYVGALNPNYGKQHSADTRKKISEALKGVFAGENNPNYGKHISEGQKRLISEGRRGNHYPKLSESLKKSPACIAVREKQKVPVVQYTKTGEFIAVWPSAADASMQLLGHSRGQSNICSCATGSLKSAYGFVWRRMNEQTTI